jgi:hypothetical protein
MYTHDYCDICLYTNLSIGWMPLCHDSQHSCIGSPGDAVRGASCFQFNFSSAIGIRMFNDLYIYMYTYIMECSPPTEAYFFQMKRP